MSRWTILAGVLVLCGCQRPETKGPVHVVQKADAKDGPIAKGKDVDSVVEPKTPDETSDKKLGKVPAWELETSAKNLSITLTPIARRGKDARPKIVDAVDKLGESMVDDPESAKRLGSLFDAHGAVRVRALDAKALNIMPGGPPSFARELFVALRFTASRDEELSSDKSIPPIHEGTMTVGVALGGPAPRWKGNAALLRAIALAANDHMLRRDLGYWMTLGSYDGDEAALKAQWAKSPEQMRMHLDEAIAGLRERDAK